MHKNCTIFRLLSLSLSLSWICTLEYVSRITITNFPRKQEISKAFPRTEKINKTVRRNFIISIFTRLKSTKHSPSAPSRRHLAGQSRLERNETGRAFDRLPFSPLKNGIVRGDREERESSRHSRREAPREE